MSGPEDENKPSKYQRKRVSTKTATLKAELEEMLSRPLLARGVSARYITSGSRPIADDIVSGKVHQTMLGLKQTDAGTDVVVAKKKRLLVNKEENQQVEEWAGLGS
ncbi:hypothetical protein PAXRUDRAFT_570592 [Paxillus rubicundulus Ve08.2h10]|uniref:Uncharacterized protein n=1 Tax=Paxillus rubicundulus Ve08.2h10 TaxID=930991 RepID=A0A0D0E970_9AGAM|nr:hypothetical protein PAXRUDRAFT_570592 [Paxillus rubicundulus Ve08.2h10]